MSPRLDPGLGLRVVAGPTSTSLARLVAEILHSRIVDVQYRLFPDGESYVRLLGEVEGDDVAVVQTLSRPQDTAFVQLLQLLSAAKEHGAKRVHAIVPYMAYARQDKQFLRGEAVTARIFAKAVEAAGADRFVTVEAHSPRALQGFSIPAKSISGAPVVAECLREMGLEGAYILGPDEGAADRARELACLVGGEWGWVKKTRDKATGEVAVEEKELRVSRKNVVVYDDVISTGGTIVENVRLLVKQNPARILAVCVHPILVGNAVERILSAGAETLVATDTLPSQVKTASVAPLLAEDLLSSANT